MKKKIVIIEPSSIIREGLKAIIQGSSDFSIIKEIPHLYEYNFDPIILMADVLLFNPMETGLYHTAKQIKSWKEKNNSLSFIAIQTCHCSERTLTEFDETITLTEESDSILRKIKKVSFLNNEDEGADNNELSLREKNVLVLVAQGLTNKEIADKLSISAHTVISHRKNITKKTNIKSVSGLTLYALLNKLIDQNNIL